MPRSLVDAADSKADVQRILDELQRAEGDPAAQLAAFAGFDRRLFEHGGDVLRVIMEGRRQEPDLAAAYVDGRKRGELARRRIFRTWPASAWQPGAGVRRALDIYAVLCSIESYDVATLERGWSPSRVERWWHQTLVSQLLA